jgi:hypothetical protein
MFILLDNIHPGIELSKINKIIITYFNLKSDLISIFDNNYPFNENIIPTITSILECAPRISNYKQYTCIDGNITLKQTKTGRQLLTNPTFQYPSFYADINILEHDTNNTISIVKEELLTSLIDNDDNQLIRMYNMINLDNEVSSEVGNEVYKSSDFTQNILDEIEYKKISWEYDWGSVDIIINLNSGLCNYQIAIDIIEENKMIDSRVASINTTLQKINKIKSEFIIDYL